MARHLDWYVVLDADTRERLMVAQARESWHPPTWYRVRCMPEGAVVEQQEHGGPWMRLAGCWPTAADAQAAVL